MYLFQKRGTDDHNQMNFKQIQTNFIIAALHGQAPKYISIYIIS